jgi:hypothetical protein
MGLYDADNKAVTAGDLKVLDYWRAKFNAEMLEQAIKTRQPEGVIGLELVGAISLLDDLRKTYPAHEGLKAWRERAAAVQAMIDPNASRSGSFDGRCLWNEHSYREAYVGYHCGQCADAEGDHTFAADCYKTAAQKLGYLQRRIEEGERVENWSPEAIAWVSDTAAAVAQKRSG